MGRKATKVLVFFLLLLSYSFSVSAAEGWTVQGDAVTGEEGIILTEKYDSNAIGVYSKIIPIDTSKGFRISFDYWVGDVYAKSRKGFKFIMSSDPIKEYGVDYKDYKKYFHVVHFASYEGRKGDIVIKQNEHDKVTTLSEEYSFKIADDTWHNVVIQYTNGTITVVVDGNIIHENISCILPSIVYVGFDASTPYYGSQKHVIANVNLQATDAYKVNLNANGGECKKTYIYAAPNTAAAFPEPTKEHHTFLGWYSAAKGGTRMDGNAYPFANEQIAYARWKDNRLKVTFHPNKGKVSKKSLLLMKGEKLGSLPTPKRNGYTFVGWYTKKSGGKKIAEDYVVKKKITFYAHWVKSSKKIKITLNKNGGSCKTSSVTVKMSGKLKNLPTATRKGYTFLGWYTKKNGGTKVTASTKMKDIYPVKKLYAHWRKGGSSSSSGNNNRNEKDSVLKCTSCKGTGKCSKCGGDGYRYSYAMGNEKLNCYKCSKTGRCSTCGGTGKR